MVAQAGTKAISDLASDGLVAVDAAALVLPAPINGGTFGVGPDTLTITLSEDRWQGDAQASITIDNKKLTATPLTVTAIHGKGAVETFTFKGAFGSGSHVVGVSFLNDAWGGSASTDRNLYVAGIVLDGNSAPSLGAPGLAVPSELHTTSTQAFAVTGGAALVPSAIVAPAPPVPPAPINGGTFGSGGDTLVMTLSEDAWQGDALATITIDGKSLTANPLAVTALQRLGGTESFTFKGNFGAGPHQVAVSFLNDAWGGSALTDRNLYVDGVVLDGASSPALAGGGTELHTSGAASFGVTGGTAASPPISSAPPVTPVNAAVVFGASQYISAGPVLQYDSTQSWSVTATVAISAPAPGPGPLLPGGGADVIFGNTNGAPYQGYEAWADDSGDLRVRIMSNFLAGSYIDVAGSTDVADGKMHFIGVSYDGSSKAAGVTLYVDGKQEVTRVLSDTLAGSSASNGPMIIGNQLNGWQNQFQMRGAMTEFSISNEARPASYFQPAAGGLPPVDSHTQLAYNFSGGAGTNVADLSGNGRAGVLSSVAMWTNT